MPSNKRISKEGFYGGPDVLHSLHCLNSIRKHLDMEYYAGSITLPPEYRRIHIDHCVDHLRQALLCHGDLTPVTIKPLPQTLPCHIQSRFILDRLSVSILAGVRKPFETGSLPAGNEQVVLSQSTWNHDEGEKKNYWQKYLLGWWLWEVVILLLVTTRTWSSRCMYNLNYSLWNKQSVFLWTTTHRPQ